MSIRFLLSGTMKILRSFNARNVEKCYHSCGHGEAIFSSEVSWLEVLRRRVESESCLFSAADVFRLQKRRTGTLVDRQTADDGFKFPWPFPKARSLLYRMRSYLTIGFVASLSKLLFVGGDDLIAF